MLEQKSRTLIGSEIQTNILRTRKYEFAIFSFAFSLLEFKQKHPAIWKSLKGWRGGETEIWMKSSY